MSEDDVLKRATTEQIDAFVQVVVLVAYADGDLSDAEAEVLVQRVKQLAGTRVSDQKLRELMEELPPLSRGSSNWRRDRLARLRENLPGQELRQEAFRLAVDVAKSDDRIGLREGRMLVNIVAELGISTDFAQKVLEYKESGKS